MNCTQEMLRKYLMKDALGYPFKTNTNIYKYLRNEHYTTLEDNSGGHKRLCWHSDKI
jgi:hypothetical protein